MEYYSAINKEQTTDRYNSIDESQKPYAKGNVQDTRDHLLEDSFYKTFWKGKTMGTEIRTVVMGGGKNRLQKEYWPMEMF